MKNTTKLFLTTAVCLGFASTSFAQSTATATASATIVTPISIVEDVNMDFGNVAVGASGGTVILTTAGARSKTGGVTLPAVIGTPAAASFTVTGEGSYTYTIDILPTTPLTITSGANTMTVTDFNSDPTPTGALSSGTQTVTVGATLHVGATQPAGTYVSGTPFSVTVNYN